MSDTKILQAILDKVTAIEKDLKRVDKKIDDKVDGLEKHLTTRINLLGAQLAELDDDAPDSGQFKALERRVKKLEVKISSFSS